MYRINPTSNKVINTELAEIREVNKEEALTARKVYSNLKNKAFDVIPEDGRELQESCTCTDIGSFSLIRACNTLIEFLEFEEIEEVEVPEIDLEEAKDRYAFIESTLYSDMTAHQLALVLFHDLGTEFEVQTMSMNAGLKLKLDLLDELKSHLVEKYPDIRTEVLTAKLANALAVTKLEKGSSLALSEGNLAVYNYMATTKVVDSKSFEFLAEIGGDTTKSLDILILQSAFRSYKEAVAKGDLPTTSAEFNLAVMRMSSGITETTTKSIANLDNLF
mgnify:CR=1 FL=1|jgi:hypothetical protein